LRKIEGTEGHFHSWENTKWDVCLRTRGAENKDEQRREDLSRGKE
jgi:hypothetical protein